MLGNSLTSSFGGGSADMGNGVYEEFASVPDHVCNGLFLIGEYGFRTRRMASF